MQNDWWTGFAERTQRYADMVDMHAFYEAHPSPLSSWDGSTLLTDKEAILQPWSEHFEGLFRDRRTVQESSLAKIPQVDVKLDLDDPPTSTEVKQCSKSSRICSPTVGREGLYRRTSGMQSLSLCEGRKIRLFKLLRHHSALHCRQNLGSRLAE